MQCSVCLKVFKREDLLQSCCDNKFYCRNCFRTGRSSNETLYNSPGSSYKNVFPESKKRIFYDEEIPCCSYAKPATLKPEGNTLRLSPSKRPIQCPHVTCTRYVSISDLVDHFQHRHPEVPITRTTLDARNSFRFNPRDILPETMHCLGLFNLVRAETGDSRSKDETTVAVLAARRNPTSSYDKNFEEILLWAGSNVWCDFDYTITASDAADEVKMKYCGPLQQLNKNCIQMCLNYEQNLPLIDFQFLEMSKFETTPINLDFVIHSKA